MNKRQFLSVEQGVAGADSSHGRTSSATAGQTDLDSKAAVSIAARRAAWSQSAVLTNRISKASIQWHMAPQQGHPPVTGSLTQV
ncbi:hypothetical protein WJX82_009989 [Trebouxia sp. C0006]